MPKIQTKVPRSQLGKAMKKAGANVPKKNTEPAWKGPQVDGVTQSLLSPYLVCKERFRIKTIEGLAPHEEFNHVIEYGNMWHECEESLAMYTSPAPSDQKCADMSWRSRLRDYCEKLCIKYQLQQTQIEKWYQVCKTQFPIYVEYWKKHPDVKKRTPLLAEETFKVPYTLPSGRVVLLRGKWDSVDLVGKGHNARIWLMENKTKGDVKEEQMQRQLTYDLQTMLYLIALREQLYNFDTVDNSLLGGDYGMPIGVRYNVIRRPLSGGKGSIKQKKPCKKYPNGQTLLEYYDELGGIIQEEPETYFMRWNVEITEKDVEKFKRETLNPVLENLCDDYEWWVACMKQELSPYSYMTRHSLFPDHRLRHFRFPYGPYHVIGQGRVGELDQYLVNGDELGLERKSDLFPELM